MTHPPFDLTPGDPTSSPDDPLDPALAAALRGLRPLGPRRDLWPEISSRLDLTHRNAAPPAAPRPDAPREPVGPGRVLAFPAPNASARPASRRWLAAAAAVIAAVSSGATYLAVRRPAEPQVAAARTAAAPRPAPSHAPASGIPESAAPGAGEAAPGASDAAPHTSRQAEGDLAAAARVAQRTERRRDAAELRAVADPGPVDAAVPGAAEYDREIAQLRAVVADRHTELDSATVAVLVRNLQIIDAAIAASRAALRRDPHSAFLGEQLTRALGQKVDLLRTAALLPRT